MKTIDLIRKKKKKPINKTQEPKVDPNENDVQNV